MVATSKVARLHTVCLSTRGYMEWRLRNEYLLPRRRARKSRLLRRVRVEAEDTIMHA
jgi:hypothetical protein